MNDSTSPNAPLPPDYYLTNFQFLINWMQEHYRDLLSEDEQQLIAKFTALTSQSQCLFVRLASRKGQLFRADKLSYSEIPQLHCAADELIAAGLLAVSFSVTAEEFSSLITKVELLNLFRNELLIYKSESKLFLAALLAENHPHAKPWSEWTNHQLGVLYRVDGKDIISNFLLLFFGNAHQDLTEFVLQDLGLFRYENYQIDHAHRIFKSRSELEEYQQIMLLREACSGASDLEQLINITQALNALPVSNSITHRRARLCNQLAYEFERHAQYDLAYTLYQQSHLPPARERKIRLLERKGDYADAWQLVNEVLSNPLNEHELQIVHRMAPRLAKKCGEQFTKKLTTSVTEQHHDLPQLFNNDSVALRVEEIVRLHFHTKEAPCFYVENNLLCGLFGLWLWPEMFRSLDGAFANPFQMSPLDLYETHFASRRPQIADLWKLFETDFHHEHIHEIWHSKNGIANHFVNWQMLDKNLIEMALACIPARHLQVIFERILFDIKNNRSGFPDLIQFFPDTKSYRMLEVKGPGDRIQDNQQRWLDYFSQHKIPAEVVYVSWQ